MIYQNNRSKKTKKTKRRLREKVIPIIILIVCITIVIFKNSNALLKEHKESLTYDQVIVDVKLGEIVKIKTVEGKTKITVTMADGTEKTSQVPSVEEFASFISAEIENGSKIRVEVEEGNKVDFTMIVSLALLIFMWVLLRNVRNDNTKFKAANSDVRFDDVAGIEEEKEELVEIVSFLKEPEKYEKAGAQIPKGVLLNGEPGNGKTLLAKAIAGEAGVPVYVVTGSDFEESFVGVGASRARKLFKQAKENAPCIIFIDEFDALAQKRYTGESDSEQTLNQFLSEMDGFDSSDNVIVIAATNHVEVLDPAVIRSGRFDKHIFIPSPDITAREKILMIHAKNKCFASDVSLNEIAEKTIGFSGADLKNILNEAAIYAVNHERTYISSSDIEEAIVRVLIGLEKKGVKVTQEDKKLTSVHEAGHAVISAVLRPDVKILGISIVNRGNAGGYNLFSRNEEKYKRKSDILKDISVLYGGRVAEEILLKEISSGASDDMEKSSKMAYEMVTKFAMCEGKLLVRLSDEKEFNNKLDDLRIEEAEKICQEAYEKARQIIRSNIEAVVAISDSLFKKEYLSKEEVDRIIKENLE